MAIVSRNGGEALSRTPANLPLDPSFLEARTGVTFKPQLDKGSSGGDNDDGRERIRQRFED